jgi:hypothetical protein
MVGGMMEDSDFLTGTVLILALALNVAAVVFVALAWWGV